MKKVYKNPSTETVALTSLAMQPTSDLGGSISGSSSSDPVVGEAPSRRKVIGGI